jgi:hypothetical protein
MNNTIKFTLIGFEINAEFINKFLVFLNKFKYKYIKLRSYISNMIRFMNLTESL